jgi:FAD:protein FMN transferase
MSRPQLLTRRSFLLLPTVMPLASSGRWWHQGTSDLHRFAFEHVVGTSLDLDLWSGSPAVAEHAALALLDEIERLTGILSTRDPGSEISRLDETPRRRPSADLAAVLDAYDEWEHRTLGAVSISTRGNDTSRNVDALGKAYILDRAAAVAADVSGIDGVLLNIGGDIVVRGRSVDIEIIDPAAWQDNANPLTRVRLCDQAIATSGSYARGAHLVDARTGQLVRMASGASVIGPTALEANALATMLCVSKADEGMRLVEQTPGAEAIRINLDGRILRSSRFAPFEQPRIVAAATANWPTGYELNIGLTLTAGAGAAGQGGTGGFGRRSGGRGRGGVRRPYVAVWIEDTSGRLVRVLAFWADNPRYYSELSSFYTIVGRDERRLATLARATRFAGAYHLAWDGMDESRASVPPGSYRVVVEANQEHGSYGKQSGVIVCGDKPAHITLSATADFDAVNVDFGPRSSQA